MADTLHPLVASTSFATRLKGLVDGTDQAVPSQSGRSRPVVTGGRRQIVVVLKDLIGQPLGDVYRRTARAEQLIWTPEPATLIRVLRTTPDLQPLGHFTLTDSTGQVSESIDLSASTDDFAAALASWGLPDLKVTVGGRPQQWRCLHLDFLSDANDVLVQQGSVIIRPTQWIGSGEEVTVYYAHDLPDRLPPGTVCICELIRGQWVLTSWEYQADETPAEDSTQVTVPTCGLQRLPAGEDLGCTVCGEHTPQVLRLFGARRVFGETDQFFLQGPPTQVMPRGTPTLLDYDSGCVFKSDLVAEGQFYWQLTLYEVPFVGPTGKLELIGTDDYGEDLYLLYWTAEPFSCLGDTRFKKVAQQCRGTQTYPVWTFGECITVSASGENCAGLLAEWGCGPYLKTEFLGTTLTAGPSSPFEGHQSLPALGLIYINAGTSSGILRTEAYWKGSGCRFAARESTALPRMDLTLIYTSLNLAPSTVQGWHLWLEADITYLDDDGNTDTVSYVHRIDATEREWPSCRGATATYTPPWTDPVKPLPAGLPQEIRISQWP